MSEWFTSMWGLISVAVYFLTWGLIPIVLLQRKNPLATLAWVWSILLFPFFGPLFYILVGTPRVHRRSLEQRIKIRQEVIAPLSGHEIETPPQKNAEVFHALGAINKMPITHGNALELLVDGDAFFPRLLADIKAAKEHLHAEFYIWRDNPIGIELRDALVRAAERGVEVRLIVDEIGSLATRRIFFEPIVAAGGRFSWFSTFAPLKGAFHINLRTHRKLVVIDGCIGYVGGINIGQEYFTLENGGNGHRDLQYRVKGPAVTTLAEVFAEDWCFSYEEQLLSASYFPEQATAGEASALVVAGGPDNDVEEITLTLVHMVNSSRDRLWMTTPYFIPDNTMLVALQLAALRGADVQLLVPAHGNHWYVNPVAHSFYEDLLPYGIRIFEYQPSLLHSKMVLVDQAVGMVGSANLDIRSLRINFELGIVVEGGGTLAILEKQFEEYRRSSSEVSLAAFRARPLGHKLLEAALRPLSPML